MREHVASAVYAETCPNCGSRNYFDIGDPEDMTGVDVEGLECWRCHHRWLLEPVYDLVTIDDANIEKGRKVVR